MALTGPLTWAPPTLASNAVVWKPQGTGDTRFVANFTGSGPTTIYQGGYSFEAAFSYSALAGRDLLIIMPGRSDHRVGAPGGSNNQVEPLGGGLSFKNWGNVVLLGGHVQIPWQGRNAKLTAIAASGATYLQLDNLQDWIAPSIFTQLAASTVVGQSTMLVPAAAGDGFGLGTTFTVGGVTKTVQSVAPGSPNTQVTVTAPWTTVIGAGTNIFGGGTGAINAAVKQRNSIVSGQTTDLPIKNIDYLNNRIYLASPLPSTTLVNATAVNALTITLNSTVATPINHGTVMNIGGEVRVVQSKSGGTITLKTALSSAHAAGSVVTWEWPAEHTMVFPGATRRQVPGPANNNGIVHVEGLLIDGDAVKGPQGGGNLQTCRYQNVRTVVYARDAQPPSGGRSTTSDLHATGTHMIGANKRYEIDGFTVKTDYEGISIQPYGSATPTDPSLRVATVEMRRVNAEPGWPPGQMHPAAANSGILAYPSSQAGPTGTPANTTPYVPTAGYGRHMLFHDNDFNGPTVLSEYYVVAGVGNSLPTGTVIFWDTTQPNNGATMTVPAGKGSGTVLAGPPPGGDFVPASGTGVAGRNYITPGYNTGLTTVTVTAPPSGSSTTNNRPTISGTCGSAAGDGTVITIELFSGSTATGTPLVTETVTRSGGTWSKQLTATRPNGTYTVRAKQTNGSGTATSPAITFSIVAPTAPAPTILTPATNSVLQDRTPTFTGTAGNAAGDSPDVAVIIRTHPGGAFVQLFGTQRTGTTWTATGTTDLADGTYSAVAAQNNDTGNGAAGQSAGRVFQIGVRPLRHDPAVVVPLDPANTITINVGTGTSTWFEPHGITITTDPGTWHPSNKDLLIILPSVVRGPVAVWGGRNIHVIGGSLKAIANGSRGLLNFTECYGNVYLEGLLLDMAGFYGDAIRAFGTNPVPGYYDAILTAPKVFQQNIRIQGIHGTYDRNDVPGVPEAHSDGYMTYGPIDSYSMDRVTIKSDYVGALVHAGSGIIGHGKSALRDVNVVGWNSDLPFEEFATLGYYFIGSHADALGAIDVSDPDRAARMLSMETAYPVELENVWLDPKPGTNLLDHSVTPNRGFINTDGVAIGPVDDGSGNALFPAASKLTGPNGATPGVIKTGTPPTGDFVPVENVGLGYTTPGYEAPGPYPLEIVVPEGQDQEFADNTPTFIGSCGNAAGDSATVTLTVYQGIGILGTNLGSVAITRAGAVWSHTLAPRANGTYTVRVSQTNTTTGLTSYSAPYSYTLVEPPTPPPVVAITSPAGGSSFSDSTPTVSGTCGNGGTDAASVFLEVYSGPVVTGTALSTVTITRSTTTWTTTLAALPNGTYTVRARQNNPGGTGYSAPITFTIVAPPPPSVVITSPVGGTQTSDNTPTIGGTCGNATGDSTTVTLKVYTGPEIDPLTLLQTIPITRSGTSWTTTLTTLPDNYYTLEASQVTTLDNGNTGVSANVTFIVDAIPNTAPAVHISVPTAAQVFATDRPAISGTCATGSGDATNIGILIQEADGTFVLLTGATASAGTWSLTLPTLPDGKYILTAYQNNSLSGLTGSEAKVFEVDAIPNTPPTVTITAPTASQEVGIRPTFSGACGNGTGDSSVITLTIRDLGGNVVSTYTTLRTTTSWSVTATTPLFPGTYVAQATQLNTLSNLTGADVGRSFVVVAEAVTAPAVNITVPESRQQISDSTPRFFGTASEQPGDVAEITLYIWQDISGELVETLTAEVVDGAWSAVATTLPDGDYSARATQFNTITGLTGQSD